MRSSAVAALVAAVFTGLLLLGERASLPELAVLKQQHQQLARGGYDLVELAAPRLTGLPLRVRPHIRPLAVSCLGLMTAFPCFLPVWQALAWLIRQPVLGRIIANVLYKDNRMLEIRRLGPTPHHCFVPLCLSL
ncbi:hypothetical protein PINS_up015257 [Pythium insidiosum]|nr:hypothetical protein PINS_up015257 [Pythium insidiosum]